LRDFVELDLGSEGLNRSVVICAGSNEAAAVRLKAAYAGTTVAEAFRDRGKKVLLIIDSVTCVARAYRQLAVAHGEAMGPSGYPPSLFPELAKLLERGGSGETLPSRAPIRRWRSAALLTRSLMSYALL
jgi:flagellar biosynthesis/type III secretory pathway ATPase